jgi:hypothetical protein
MKTRTQTRTKATLNPQQKQIAKAVFGDMLGGQILAEAELGKLKDAVDTIKSTLVGQIEQLVEQVKALDSRLTELERRKGFLNFAGKFFPTTNGENKSTVAGEYFRPINGKGTGVASKLFDGDE